MENIKDVLGHNARIARLTFLEAMLSPSVSLSVIIQEDLKIVILRKRLWPSCSISRRALDGLSRGNPGNAIGAEVSVIRKSPPAPPSTPSILVENKLITRLEMTYGLFPLTARHFERFAAARGSGLCDTMHNTSLVRNTEYRKTDFMVYETGGSFQHSHGLSNNTYPVRPMQLLTLTCIYDF